jgi:hypothetical protein
MNNIDQVLQQNSFQVNQLLRRSRIIGEPTMESIQRGFEKHGEPFMMKLLQIITPTESSFSDLIQPKTVILSTGVSTTQLMPIKTATTATTTETTGKVWTFWEKLLGGIGATGEALGKFKNDLAAEPSKTETTPEQVAAAASNSKILYMVAAGFVALIILILILRK